MSITPQQLAPHLKEGGTIDLIDVRTPVEFKEVHVAGSRNVPLDQLEASTLLRDRKAPAEDPIYFVCRSGARGQQACEKFATAGFSNVVNVDGGTIACIQAGLPMIRGPKSVSLERQVRIAAGSFVLVGTILALAVHPAFIGLPLFVGAGLIFSGLTDTCGMGMILARMPWNR